MTFDLSQRWHGSWHLVDIWLVLRLQYVRHIRIYMLFVALAKNDILPKIEKVTSFCPKRASLSTQQKSLSKVSSIFFTIAPFLCLKFKKINQTRQQTSSKHFLSYSLARLSGSMCSAVRPEVRLLFCKWLGQLSTDTRVILSTNLHHLLI